MRMKKLLTFLTLLTLFFTAGWADEVTYTFTSKSWEATPANWSGTANGNQFNTSGTPKGVQVTTGAGSGATITCPVSYDNISKVEVTYSSSKSAVATISVSIGTFQIGQYSVSKSQTETTLTYTPNVIRSGVVSFTPTVKNNSIGINSVKIYYTPSGSTTETCATPTFSPVAGTYYEPQSVTLSCITPGSTIYYTTNGDDPTTSSSVYANPIDVSTTTTIKAIAVKSGMNNSGIGEATYTLYTPATVTVPPTYSNTFKSGFGDFYVNEVSNEKPSAIWTSSSSYGAVGNGGSSTGNSATLYASESWLISPYIDLTGANNPQLSFSHAGSRFSSQENMKNDVKVLIKKQGDTQWTDLNVETWPNGTSWTFVDNETSLSSYAGEVIQIAFKYTSSTERAGVWEITNFKVENIAAYEIFRHYKTLGADNNNAEGWMGYWGGGATTPNGSDYDNYLVQATAGTTVTFLIGHNNNNYTLDPSNISVTYGNGTTVDDLVISDVNEYGQTPVSFTMPASNVDVTANFTYYRPTLRMAGRFNGRSGWITDNSGPEFEYDLTNDVYTIDVYFTGTVGDYFYFRQDNQDLKAANGNEANYGLNEGNITNGSHSLGGGRNFEIIPGVYTFTVSGDLSSLTITPKEPTITFSPAEGEVYSGTSVSATSTLTDLIDAIKATDSGATGTVSVQVSTDGNTFTDAVTLTADATVHAKASIGNYSVTDEASYTIKEFTGDEYTLVTDVNDIDENGEYIVVTSKAFSDKYYAMGAISGGTSTQVEVAVVDDKAYVTGDAVNVLTIKGDATNGFDIQQLDNGNFLYGTSGGNIVSTDNESNVEYYWYVTINNNNLATISYGGTTTRSIIYRESAGGFKNYATSNANSNGYSTVKLYKKGTSTPKVETPTFTPEGGTYNEALSVTISCETSGATIYYTTNGSTPTVDYGTVYSGAITVDKTTTIKAIAVLNGYLNSDVATATYTIHTSVIGEGDFTLVESDGDIEADREYIIINSAKDKAASAHANNRFTSTENFELTNNDKTASIESDVKVFILEAGENDGKYYLKDSEGNYYTPATGSGNITQSKTELTVQYSDGYVVITSGTVGSTRQIGYNEQGGQEVFGSFTPNTISPTGNGTLRPIYLYYRGGAAVSKPVINPASKVFTEEFDATITCSTQGATIYYTIDGTDPTTSSAVYSNPIHVDKTMTIKAIAAKDGEVSGVAEAVYQCTMVENIAEYLTLPIGTENVVFKNPVVVQYHYISSSGKSYIYVKDETGCAYFHQPYETEGTPSMDQLENGDVIGARFYGDKDYDEAVDGVSQYAMFTNLVNFAATGNKALAEPELKTVSDIIASNAAELNNHYITINKVKLSNLYQALSYGGAKYFDIYDESGTIGQDHIGYNKFNIDYASVVDDLDAYYNITGIFTAYNNLLEFHPTEVVKWAEKEVTLRDLCENGEEGESYKITNNLQGVVAVGTSLWVKDENGQSIHKVTPTAPYTENFEVLADGNTRSNQADYDQSNWCEIVFPDAATAKSFENKIISGYSIEGVFNKKANPKLTLSANAQVEEYGTSDVYAPNYYLPANFVGSQSCNTDQYGQEGHGDFFFMTPKPQEYAQIVWAIYDGVKDGKPTFIISPDKNRNAHQFSGVFVVDLSMNTGVTSTSQITEGYGYDFTAIIRMVETTSSNAPSLKRQGDIQNDQSANYIVYPLDLDEGQNPATAINTVDVNGKAVKSVKYVNVAGMVSDKPFSGVNIVVTEYTDGSRSTTKMLRK